jgi:general secretion pathway protein D
VPILGDIPILGALFRSDSKDDTRTELLVLITPYVVNTPAEAQAETRRLHESTNLRETDWVRGWSDSQLATPPKSATPKEQRGWWFKKEKDFKKGKQSEQPPLPKASVSRKEEIKPIFSKPAYPDEPGDNSEAWPPEETTAPDKSAPGRPAADDAQNDELNQPVPL